MGLPAPPVTNDVQTVSLNLSAQCVNNKLSSPSTKVDSPVNIVKKLFRGASFVNRIQPAKHVSRDTL